MKILIDVMGADRAPVELLNGALQATGLDADISVVGDERLLRDSAASAGLSLDRISILPASDVICMEDKPMSVIREKNQSSMAIGLRALAHGEFDAFVSAGNTGALLTGGTLIVRRIRGISRAAIGTVLPFSPPLLLMDAGANLEVTPENVEQFAFMGSRYMAHLYGIEAPRVGQLNNGAESTKGLPLQVECFRRLSESKDVRFIGNVEAKMLPFDVCDVIVTDGFTGNIVLKYTEGLGKYMSDSLKGMFLSGWLPKLSALVMKKQLRAFKHRFDASEHGGAPLLGLAKPVIKAHGSSDARAIRNAVRQAIRVAGTDYTSDIEAYAAEQKRKAQNEQSEE